MYIAKKNTHSPWLYAAPLITMHVRVSRGKRGNTEEGGGVGRGGKGAIGRSKVTGTVSSFTFLKSHTILGLSFFEP